jgi:hypothetical protein
MKKKGQLDMLKGLILSLVVIGVVIALAFLMMGQINTTATTIAGTGSYAANGTTSVLAAMGGIPAWLPLIVVAVIGVIVFGLIGMFYRSK